MNASVETAIVVSLHKAGTNLVARLVRSLGFTAIGAGVRESYELIFRMLDERRDSPSFLRYANSKESILADSVALLDLCLAHASNRTCVFLHSAVRRGGLVDSFPGGHFPVIFNYRDPRAVLVSFVHYLANGAREEFTKSAGYTELAAVLRRLPNTEARLKFVMKYVPNYVEGVFMTSAWLLREPSVVGVSYEELVGSRGGGDDEAQRRATRRIMELLGTGGDVGRIVESLYSDGARTFRKGSIAGWKEDFTPEVEELFRRKYQHVLDEFGYR